MVLFKFSQDEKGDQESLTPQSKKKSKKKKKTSQANQKYFEMLCAAWTASSFRPFSISEDSMLLEMFEFQASVNEQLKMPSRNTNKKSIVLIYNWLQGEVKNGMEMEFFSCTSNIWSS